MLGFSALSEAPISATAEAQLPAVVVPVGAIGASPIGVYAIGRASITTGGVAVVNATATSTSNTLNVNAPAPAVLASSQGSATVGTIVVSPAVANASILAVGSSTVGTVAVSVPTAAVSIVSQAFSQLPTITASSPEATPNSNASIAVGLPQIIVGTPLVNETVVEIVLDTPAISVAVPAVEVYIGTTLVTDFITRTTSDLYDQSVPFSLEDPVVSNIEKRWLMRSLTTGVPGTINERFFAAYYTSAAAPYDHDINVYEVDSAGNLITGNPVNSRTFTVLGFLDRPEYDASVISTSGTTWFSTGGVIIPYIIENFAGNLKSPTVQQMTFNINVTSNGDSLANTASQLGSSFYAPRLNGNQLTNKDFHSYGNNDGAFPYYGVYDGREPELYLIWMFGAGATKQGWITNGDGDVNEELYNTSTTSVWQTIIDGFLDPANNFAIPDASGLSGLYSAAPNTSRDNQGLLSQRLTFDNQVFELNKYVRVDLDRPNNPTGVINVQPPLRSLALAIPVVSVTAPQGTTGGAAIGSATIPVVALTSPQAISGAFSNASAELPFVNVTPAASTATVSVVASAVTPALTVVFPAAEATSTSIAAVILPSITVGAPLTTETVVEIPIANPPITVSAPAATLAVTSTASAQLVVVTTTAPQATLSASSTAAATLVTITVSPAQTSLTLNALIEATLPVVTVTAPETIEVVVEQVALPQVTLTPAEATLSGSAVATYALVLVDASAPQATATAASTADTAVVTVSVGVPGVNAVGTSGGTASASLPTVTVSALEPTVLVSSSASATIPQVTVVAPFATETVVEVPLAQPPVTVFAPEPTSTGNAAVGAPSNTVTVSPADPAALSSPRATAALPQITVGAPLTTETVVEIPLAKPPVIVSAPEPTSTGNASVGAPSNTITVSPPVVAANADTRTNAIAGSTSIVAIARLVHGVEANVDGLSTLDFVEVSLVVDVEGNIQTSSQIEATETEVFSVTGDQIDGASTVTGSVERFKDVAGSAQGSTTVSADARIDVVEPTSISGSSTASAESELVHGIFASSAGSSELLSSVLHVEALVASSAGVTSISGRAFATSDIDPAALSGARTVAVEQAPTRNVGIEIASLRLTTIDQSPSRIVRVA